jgi:ABC-type lipoprotein export system ATPase subunit
MIKLYLVQNVNVILEQHVTENVEVALTLSRLTEERQRLQARIKELEEQLKAKVKTNSSTLHWYF